MSREPRIGCDDASDLAPSFVLGALDPVTTAAVRAHLSDCGQPHQEFAELGQVLPYVLESVEPVPPPPGLRARVMASVGAAPSAGSAPAAIDSGLTRPVRTPQPWRAGIRGSRAFDFPPQLVRWALAAAAILAIAGLGLANVRLQEQANQDRAYAQALERVLAVVSEPGSEVVTLTGGASTPGSSGIAAFARTASERTGVLVVHGLRPTQGSQVYQAWVIVAGSPPRPAGGFTVGGDGIGWLSGLSAPRDVSLVVGLTLEAQPGATAPTLPMVASGAVGS